MWQFHFRGCNLCASSKEDGTPSEWKTMKFLEVRLPPIAHSSTHPAPPSLTVFLLTEKKKKGEGQVKGQVSTCPIR